MSDLIINFDERPHPAGPIRPVTTTSGSWTQKLRQKRQARERFLKSNNRPSSTNKQTTDGSDQKLEKKENQQLKYLGDVVIGTKDNGSELLEPENGLEKDTKKPRLGKGLDPKLPPQRIQIISSLFSSTILPTIKPSDNNDGTNLTVCAPSNACLSEIKLSSPSLGLHPQIAHHLSSNPKMDLIKSPTRIQSIAWPLLTSKSTDLARDVIIQSQTGSGKTLAYLVPIVQDLLTLASSSSQSEIWKREIGTLAIVLVPTRELAEQVYGVAIKLLGFARGNNNSKTNPADEEIVQQNEDEESFQNSSLENGLSPRWLVPGTLHGGTNRTHEKARLRKGLPLLVCTPGRLLDHLEKTTSLKIAGEILSEDSRTAAGKANIDDKKFLKKKFQNRQNDTDLGLRWLVVDEADRLMDMGFEEQMRGILKHLSDREFKKSSQYRAGHQTTGMRRTVLCSATMPDGVKKLVGLTLKDPIVLRSDESFSSAVLPNGAQADDSKSKAENVNVSKENPTFSAPSQLSQNYVITPPKLRLVSLVALLRQIADQKQKTPAEKILVFMSCTASVDFHFEALTEVPQPGLKKTEDAKKKNEKKKGDRNSKEADTLSNIMKKSSLLPNIKIFRLHGNLDLSTRLASLNAFAKIPDQNEPRCSSVLFCTSLAGRGLDVPFVSHVIQYDLPTEGGVTEYLHRVGRTARAGKTGEAWTMILPNEEGWVEWCEKSQNDDHKSVRLQQVEVSKLLKDGFGGKCQRDWETRATDIQMSVERWVIENSENTKLASIGFSSHIRAYATHPSEEKRFFHVKNLHLGHLAKSFGLREAPQQISSSTSYSKQNNKNFLHQTYASRQADANDVQEKGTKKRKRVVDNDSEGEYQEDEDIFNDEDDDRVKKFRPLVQFDLNKNNRNRLRGPIKNGIDEFNVM
ncbi:ATP-dependent RNA helicase dbp7 [Phakopsora pachyrhizi]|uniref:ATP-dependent RNA helicase n=1 Tax=Phakopsora pachyrhizi TaxID=170000 RepID=A0AAV0BKQ3_PHAPC|nr:ATP-dependent RNA helicase dbp7 [Phakopsora pachyrhizi]CAH7686134.1 ATP-dependent RNA helicase dbp7 [Phakopsora pachyrhizi]